MTMNDTLYGGWMQTANIWIAEFQEHTGIEDYRKAFVAMRGTLHALRDRLPMQEAVDLAAQLPMLFKGVFFDGWTPSGKPVKIRNETAFLELVRKRLGPDAGLDPRTCVRGLIAVLTRHVTAGEMKDVVSVLPKDVVEIWREQLPSYEAP